MSNKRRIALFGGSFNPIHIGHLILAEYARVIMNFDEVWLMLSPLNPLKVNNKDLQPDDIRLKMIRLAIDGLDKIKECDIELTMPRPNYTVNTLYQLIELYPDTEFSLLIGADNFADFDKWKDPDEICRLANVVVYPREGFPMPDGSNDCIKPLDAPIIQISSTEIRKATAEQRLVAPMLPPKVYDFIISNNLYR
ncbi:MAG: nicotinate-nucleotide adenylyltransferase [Muribaculaceae bacterium]|nr:nicotinate-nucleotide adenylyltransferase [Muribaculaceae bacterium]